MSSSSKPSPANASGEESLAAKKPLAILSWQLCRFPGAVFLAAMPDVLSLIARTGRGFSFWLVFPSVKPSADGCVDPRLSA